MLPHSFNNYGDLIAEVDFCCLQEMRDWLNIEFKKNSALIALATKNDYGSRNLYITRDILILRDACMSEKERHSFCQITYSQAS